MMKKSHQKILGKIYREFSNFFEDKKCNSYLSPLDVFLDGKEKENTRVVVQP